MEAHYYDVNLNWISARKGRMTSPVLSEEIIVATPPQFPDGMAEIWSPEHLLTAAVVSCFMTTFLAIAKASRLEFKSFSCDAKGKLELVDGKYLMTEVQLFPDLLITEESDLMKAEKILAKSETACLISNSIKSKIVLVPKVKF